MSIREKFVSKFGEKQATALEAAAEEHKNGVHDHKGSDPFKWVIVICIGYDCFVKPGFREYHKITVPVDELKTWIKAEADLASHDGDLDYLSAVTGHYSEYLPEEVADND